MPMFFVSMVWNLTVVLFSTISVDVNAGCKKPAFPVEIMYNPTSSSLGCTAQLRPWPPPQNPAEFLRGFSTIFFFTR
jgi:hypothetical protein